MSAGFAKETRQTIRLRIAKIDTNGF